MRPMKAQPSLSSSFGTSEYGIEALGEFLLALVLLDLGNDDLLPILDDEIRIVVGVLSFEGKDPSRRSFGSPAHWV